MTTFQSHQDFYTDMARIAAIGLASPGTSASQYRWSNNRDWMTECHLSLVSHLHVAMGYRPGMQEI